MVAPYKEPNKAEIEKLIPECDSAAALAKRLDILVADVYVLLRKYKIEAQWRKTKLPKDPQEVKEAVSKFKNVEAVAKFYNVSKQALYKYMRVYKIKPPYRGSLGRPKTDLENLVKGSNVCVTLPTLKRHLLEVLKWAYKCAECGLTEWRGKPPPLELDHIDGNKFNNRLNNFRLLCSNCHAFTDTYRGRNVGRYKRLNKEFRQLHNLPSDNYENEK